MKHRLQAGLAIVLLLGLMACSSNGRDYDTTHLTDIQNDVTTKAQAREWFGDPFKIGQRDNLEMWTYQFDGKSGGKDESKDLILMFDDNGIVKAYRYSTNMDH